MISLQLDRATPYDSFMAAQSAFRGAVNQVRDAYSRKHFGRSYPSVELEEEGLEVRKAVPLRIFEADMR